MKNNYRDQINNIHAPRELIDQTKIKMQEEYNKKISPKKNNRVFAYVAAAACLLFTLTAGGLIKMSLITPKYEEVDLVYNDEMDLDFGLINPNEKDVSVDEFDKIWGTRISKISEVNNATMTDSLANIVYTDSIPPEAESGKTRINFNEYCLKASTKSDLMINELSKDVDINDVKVYFGIDSNDKTYVACFKKDNMWYQLVGKADSSKEFTKLVKKIINQL